MSDYIAHPARHRAFRSGDTVVVSTGPLAGRLLIVSSVGSGDYGNDAMPVPYVSAYPADDAYTLPRRYPLTVVTLIVPRD